MRGKIQLDPSLELQKKFTKNKIIYYSDISDAIITLKYKYFLCFAGTNFGET
jgi:hypothetical protein